MVSLFTRHTQSPLSSKFSATDVFNIDVFQHTVSQQRIQPILRITQNFIVAMLLRYSYVQEYVTVEIFCLALLYFQYPVTGEQSTSSIRSVFAKPNHQWMMCTLLSYSYTLKKVFSITIGQVSVHKVAHIYWWSQRRWRVGGVFGIFGVFSGDLGVLLSCKITRGMILVVGKVTERV